MPHMRVNGREDTQPGSHPSTCRRTVGQGFAAPVITVAHVNAESGFSGGEVQMFLLMEGLRARGHGNVVVAPPGSRALEEGQRRDFRALGVPMRNDLDLGAVRAMTGAFRGGGVDLVHLHTGRATWLGGLAAWRAGVPALTTRRMDRRVKPGLRTRLIYHSFVERAVAISPAVAACLREPGVPEERIRVIWDAVDPASLRPADAASARAAVRTEGGLGEREHLALITAALVQRKGIDVAIDAVAQLRLRGRSVHLWVAGEGEERGALEARVRERGVEGLVRFLGWRADKAELLAAADLALVPSRAEGVGVASLEAMAAGVPVVASRVGGLAEAVVDGETGLLVGADDVDGLARGIERVLQEPGLARRLGEAGVRRVDELFTAEQMVERYVEVYREVLAARGVPGDPLAQRGSPA